VLVYDSAAAAGDPTAWARTQTILVRALDDDVAEGERTVMVSPLHPRGVRRPVARSTRPSTSSTSPTSRWSSSTTTSAGITVRPEGAETRRRRGRVTDTYTIELTTAPAAGEIVTVWLTMGDDRVRVAAADPSQAGRVVFDETSERWYVTFDATNWTDTFTLTVSATDPDREVQGRRFVTHPATR
jgi:hypothetical protein